MWTSRRVHVARIALLALAFVLAGVVAVGTSQTSAAAAAPPDASTVAIEAQSDDPAAVDPQKDESAAIPTTQEREVPSAQAGAAAAPIVDAVILPDESGSLEPDAVDRVRDAAVAFANTLWPNSRLGIGGFGGIDGRPGQRLVNDYCGGLIVLDSDDISREQLARCANEIHRRQPREGNETDCASALRWALDLLTRAPRPGVMRVIIFLTDGELNVRSSPIYGPDRSRRNAEAERQLQEEILPALRTAGIQIWPLGFGRKASLDALQRLAIAAAGANTQCPASVPAARIVADVGDLPYDFLAALAGARCGATGERSTTTLGAGETEELSVFIPRLATTGAITVVTGLPGLELTFIDPNGDAVPAEGEFKGQRLSLAGEGGSVPSLRIENPIPGPWRVRIADPLGISDGGRIDAFAVWESTLHSSIVVTPQQPAPGEEADVELKVLSRDGVVPAPDLIGVRAHGRLSGSFGEQPVQLALDKQGVFRGRFRLPADASGTSTLVVQVSGVGVSSDSRAYELVPPPAVPRSFTFKLALPKELRRGGTYEGSFQANNPSAPVAVELAVADLSPPAELVVELGSRGPLMVPRGQTEHRFSVIVPSESRLGPLVGRLVLRASDGKVLAAQLLSAEVKEAPDPNWWVMPAAAGGGGTLALLASLFFFIRRRRVRAHVDTEGVLATLYLGDASLGHLVSPGGRVFPFAIGDPPALLQDGQPGEPIVVLRAGHVLTVRRGDGSVKRLGYEEPLALGEGLFLRFSPPAEELAQLNGDRPLQLNGDKPTDHVVLDREGGPSRWAP